jgi:replication factor A1
MQDGTTVILRNAKIDMFKGSMRLAVDRWGRVEVTEPAADFTVKEDNNLSLIEYELVNVVEE